MAEPLGIIGSLVGIAQVAKTAVDLYALYSDVRNASEDVHKVFSLFRLERVRFFLWCDYVGLTTLILVSTDSTASTNNCTTHDSLALAKTRLSSVFQHPWTLDIVSVALEHINRTFQEAGSLLETYTTKSAKSQSALSQLMFTEEAARPEGSTRLINRFNPDLSPSWGRNTRGAPKASLGFREKLAWSFKDQAKFKRFLDELRHYNDALRSILTAYETVQLERQNELLATTSALGSVVEATVVDENDSPKDIGKVAERTDMQRLVEMRTRSLQIAQPSNHTATSDAGAVSPTLVHITRASLELPMVQHDATLLAPRVVGKYKGQHVLVEWKYYSHRLTSPEFAYMRQRTAMLVLQLQQSAGVDGFSVLKCQGHFEDPDYHRIGIVFNLEPNFIPKNMQERMLEDRRQRKVRDLGARVAVARSLVLTFFRLHSVGWLHKNFRSDNVLLLESQEVGNSADDFELGPAFVCGFDLSRQDMPYELTERLPTQLREQSVARERDLYRHPDLSAPTQHILVDSNPVEEYEPPRDVSSQPRYCKAYDAYSLGVVLVEIGLWQPVRQLVRKGEAPAVFHARLLSEFLPELRYRMGKNYYNLVAKCLSGEFGDAGVGLAEESETNEHQEHSRKWLEAFLQDAVSVLERMQI
ncbi:hypothetical protein CC86DRAFT_425642 [Ophiobolus disseminans]|uniref:Protein kinase domain-containing protein n=1 Tax=Ophiobolus disseminans TaxID=1469910 RepID=A0A6A6ZNX1_9PLEO|nr:hypothetical protein CC86DRAFT_425642 [Ophiobolus disseminans]